MADKTGIQWTDATWNPSTGCSHVSPGCKHCYAEVLAKRLKAMGREKYANGFQFTVHPDALELPVHWRRPRKIFVNSMSDLHHELMPEEFLLEVFRVMNKASHHVYQDLTKRPENMRDFGKKYGYLFAPQIWCGTSVELAMYKERIDILREVPAKVRFLSCEPLLGPLGKLDLTGISWVITGGESGADHRPVQGDWFREIRDQCVDQGVAFFFKQWGGRTPKSGGRLLDGREWNEFPLCLKTNSSGNCICKKFVCHPAPCHCTVCDQDFEGSPSYENQRRGFW